MKLFTLLSILALFTFSCSRELISTKNTAYYFCYSHDMKPQEESIVKYILITEIQKIELDDQLIRQKTNEWSNLVNSLCKNKSGCTSDLNYYNTIEEAINKRNKKFEIYNNIEKYKIDKVDFK